MSISIIFWLKKKWLERIPRYNKVLLLSYVIVALTLLLKSFLPIYWQIGRFIAVLSSFSILFVSGYWITYLFEFNKDKKQELEFRLGVDLFNVCIILATGLTTSSLFVICNILLIGYFPRESFFIFLLAITLTYSKSLMDLEWNCFTKFKTEFDWKQIVDKIEVKSNLQLIMIGLATIIWFVVTSIDTDFFLKIDNIGYLCYILIQLVSFLLLFIAALYSIKHEKKTLTLISLFLILLFTRICIYKDNFIIGSDSFRHYNRFLQISEDPKLLFSFSTVFFAPITYSWMIFLKVFGNDYILPFSFILISCFAYMCIYTLGIELTSFKIASIALLFASIEFTTFRFGFEIRTFIIAILYVALWIHSLFKFKKGKRNQIIHILLIILIGLSHFSTFVIILLIEYCLSLFYLIEKIIDFIVTRTISLSEFPAFTKSNILLGPFFLIIILVFFSSNEYIKWIFGILQNLNPYYRISFDLNLLPGLISSIYSPLGMIIIWISRITLITLWFSVLIIYPNDFKKNILKRPLFRLLLYKIFSISLIFLFSMFIPNILSPSRIYALLAIAIGFLLGLNGKMLGKKGNFYIEIICFLFLLNTFVRFPYFLDLNVYQ